MSVRRGAGAGVEDIRSAREDIGPIPRKGVGPVAWFDIRKRGLGQFAFSLNRITGLGLVFYLYLHLAVLSMLFLGEEAWDDFLGLATTKLFLLLDVLLIFGLLAHGLNGLRLALIGSGRGIDHQKALYRSCQVIGTILLLGRGPPHPGRRVMAARHDRRDDRRRPRAGRARGCGPPAPASPCSLLVTIHMVAHHFVVERMGGLRTYQDVLDYVANPVMFVIECVFLVVVTIHSMLGLRSVLFDFGLSVRTKHLIDRGLVVLGVLTVAYGFLLIGVLASRA